VKVQGALLWWGVMNRSKLAEKSHRYSEYRTGTGLPGKRRNGSKKKTNEKNIATAPTVHNGCMDGIRVLLSVHRMVAGSRTVKAYIEMIEIPNFTSDLNFKRHQYFPREKKRNQFEVTVLRNGIKKIYVGQTKTWMMHKAKIVFIGHWNHFADYKSNVTNHLVRFGRDSIEYTTSILHSKI
jgi:hypothetical protein